MPRLVMDTYTKTSHEHIYQDLLSQEHIYQD